MNFSCCAEFSPDLDFAPHEPACKQDRVAMPVRSETLLGGCKELPIWHEGQLYRLQITRQGKLILTK